MHGCFDHPWSFRVPVAGGSLVVIMTRGGQIRILAGRVRPASGLDPPLHGGLTVRLRILLLCPSVLNVAGDGGNVRAIEQRARWRGLAVEVRRADPGASIDGRWADLTIIGGGQDTEMRVASVDKRAGADAPRIGRGGAVLFMMWPAGNSWAGSTFRSRARRSMASARSDLSEMRGGPGASSCSTLPAAWSSAAGARHGRRLQEPSRPGPGSARMPDLSGRSAQEPVTAARDRTEAHGPGRHAHLRDVSPRSQSCQEPHKRRPALTLALARRHIQSSSTCCRTLPESGSLGRASPRRSDMRPAACNPPAARLGR